MRELVLSVMKDALQFTNINPNDDDDKAVEEAETDGDKSGQQSENQFVSETLENAKEDSDANAGYAGKGWIIFKCAEVSLIEGIFHHTITSIPKISFKSPLS